ncbi:hypothetical protein AArcCO_0306 [Halalkaliarchaeum sp. AArc-CO]|nr:hypothetical protein AArcCO_0306 [Halalkaliarchaeum sp. AArc-CO]
MAASGSSPFPSPVDGFEFDRPVLGCFHVQDPFELLLELRLGEFMDCGVQTLLRRSLQLGV